MMADIESGAALQRRFSLEKLTSGAVARVQSIAGDPTTDRITRRLHELGFHTGAALEVLHRGPFGGNPLSVRIGSMVVALRKAEAARICVELDA